MRREDLVCQYGYRRGAIAVELDGYRLFGVHVVSFVWCACELDGYRRGA